MVCVIVDLYSSLSNCNRIYCFVTDVLSVLYEIIHIYSSLAESCLYFPAIENRKRYSTSRGINGTIYRKLYPWYNILPTGLIISTAKYIVYGMDKGLDYTLSLSVCGRIIYSYKY
jgi:hypothetical protein